MSRIALAITLASSLVGCGAPGTSDSSAVASRSSAAATPEPTRAQTATESPEPSQKAGTAIDIGGRSIWFKCIGTGSPTVILEAGMGGDLRTWEQVQPVIGASTRTCAYDRAGVGQSESAAQPRTAQDAVDDLHDALAAAEIEAPYVMVGFSFGGLVTQLYAATYPDEMAGIVLVESSHPLEAEQFEAHLTPEQIEEDRAAVLDNPEGLDPFASFEQAQDAGPLPEVPLIVVTAGISEGWPEEWGDPAVFDGIRAGHQEDLASRVPGGVQLIAESSTHHVPSQEPDVIIEAVGQVLDQLP